ncbi:hypothetical protein BDM02DRAFT_2325746 [Thelephora ganbajun]|uniref:Uncharacterized protein n=1 Tax=Thelephora ganbajun TaxID=370292 RepID=A0ACB6ZG68_THEGA|nr:hypothetical protein BDM02DRAFT_2325746 [Thelephora ganbajun]
MLSVLCFSLVPILRCAALRRIEFSTLLIPPGIELLFSIILLFKRDGTGDRYHCLLSAEGISYSLLALMDFLMHTVAILHRDLSAFRLVDIIIGGLTIAPMLCFTLWFLFTARRELIHTIPTRLRKSTKYILIGCIPLITISNAIGTFVGVSYRTLNGVNAVGFIDERAQFLWSFFNMFSLALLVVFEVIALFLLLARLTKVIHHKRRRELVNEVGEVHHFRGIIAMNLGMLLSLMETLIGFSHQSFTVGITRRGLKAAGRILIVLGLLKGWDYLEDVQFALEEPPKSKRTSRFSIRQLFPNARSTSNETQILECGYERVSVRHPRGRAPMLHLRLSEFDMNPIIKALRPPSRSPSSHHIHLVPKTPPIGTAVYTGGGYLDVRHPHHRNAPSNLTTEPHTPNSPWTVTGPTPRVGSSGDQTPRPRSPIPTQDGYLHRSIHTRGDTMSSTMSNLQVEVMTLSESPPDPGFVLPIPSRSRSRQKLGLSLANSMRTAV